MSCIKELPEFASLCSFIQLFGEELNVTLSHNQLATFLEVKDAENVPKLWIDIHRKLLSRIKYHCSITKWEGTLKKCLFNVLGYDSELANLNGTNYFEITPDNRAKILNILFDCQFDKNIKFKEKVNLKFISDLRTQPFGSDIHGCIYWLFVDSDVSIIMYKENLEEESFKIVAETLDDLQKLQQELTEMDCENAILSKLYLETSPSDEIDNSRTQSPFNDNCNEKLTIKVDSVKVENIEIAKIEETDNLSDHQLKINEIPTPVAEESEATMVIVMDETPVKIEDQDLDLNKTKVENYEITDLIIPDNNSSEILEKSIKDVTKIPGSPTPNYEDQSVNTGLRRSERKRKPVSLFSIAYPETCKKMKSSNYHKSEKEINKKSKDSKKEHKKEKIKRKKGRPRKNPEVTDENKIISKDKKKSKKTKSKHKKGRGHKKHKRGKHPWDTAESSDEHNDYDDEDETYLNEESEPSISVNEMWDDKPESDFDVDKISCSSDEETSKARGRNYFRQKSIKKKKQEIDDKPCQICLRNNIPEMILLCDECDLGHHAMCLRPSLMIIPEGDWYCPKCQHRKLLNKLTEKIVELEKSMLKNNAKIRMQERLNFVNISMSNILSRNQDRKRIRKQSCESDESPTDGNSSSQSLSSSSGTYDDSSDNSSEIDSNKPSTQGRYRFRETSRKDSTKYNFEEIDKIFDDALEADEKYKLLKKEHLEERVNRDSENSETQVESEPEYDYSGIEPRKKSSGKDMANIVSDEKPLPRSALKKKRLKYDSDYDDFEDDTKDIDFRISDQSDSEFDEYECIEADLTNCSDDDWIATSKSKRTTRKTTSRKKEKKRSSYVPDISCTTSRPKRNAARNINYRNMLCDEDDDDDRDSVLNEQSSEYKSSGDNAVKPPPVVSRKKDKYKTLGRSKRCLISDSEYEEEQEDDDDDDEAEYDEPNYEDDDDENGSGSTEKLEAGVKRNSKLDLNNDVDFDEESAPPVIAKISQIDNDGDEPGAQSIRSQLLTSTNQSALGTAAAVINTVVTSSRSSLAPLPSLATMLNPMRAKADEDNDQVENEVESETEECTLTISLSDSSTNHNGGASLT